MTKVVTSAWPLFGLRISLNLGWSWLGGILRTMRRKNVALVMLALENVNEHFSQSILK